MVQPPAISTECTHYPMRHFRVSGEITALIQDSEYLLPKWVKVGEMVEFDSETMRITKLVY